MKAYHNKGFGSTARSKLCFDEKARYFWAYFRGYELEISACALSYQFPITISTFRWMGSTNDSIGYGSL